MTEKNDPVLARNRRASHDYEILESFDAGIALQGTEVKSIRTGHVQIGEGYVRVERNEAWLYNVHISPYEQGNRNNHEPHRRRKLLLKKKEIRHIDQRIRIERLTAIPLRLVLERNWVKVTIGVARGKRKWDKRQDIAARESKRDTDREIGLAKKRGTPLE